MKHTCRTVHLYPGILPLAILLCSIIQLAVIIPTTEASTQKRYIENNNDNNRNNNKGEHVVEIRRRVISHESGGNHTVTLSEDDHNSSNSTCTSFSSYDDLIYSKCVSSVSRDKLTVLKETITNNTSWGRDFWCSCENHPCSLIYSVENGTKIKNVYLTGFVDNKAEILILAEYSSDKGEFFQIAKLNGYRDFSMGLKRIKFDYFHEGFLDVATLNVTMALNGGFSVIEDFVVIVESKEGGNKAEMTTEPPVALITLDKDEDALQKEWLEVTCHYSDFFEDFWAYGCPANADANLLPKTIGFWFPCHESECAFTYDGSAHNPPKSVNIRGYLQGGVIEISGKHQILDGAPWKTLLTKSFRNATLSELDFDLYMNCDMKVLQITITVDSNSVVIVDKISVHLETKPSTMRRCTTVFQEIEKSNVDSSNTLSSQNQASISPRNSSAAIFPLKLFNGLLLFFLFALKSFV